MGVLGEASTDESAGHDQSSGQSRSLRVVASGATAGVVFAAAGLWNPFRLIVLQDHSMLLGALACVSAVVLGVVIWSATRRWWWRAIAVPLVAAGALMIPLLVVAALVADTGEPENEIVLTSSHDEQLAVQTMQAGLAPGNSCVQVDVRTGSGLFARSRTSPCADQESEIGAQLVGDNRLLLDLGDDQCTFEVDWQDQTLRAVTRSENCLAFES